MGKFSSGILISSFLLFLTLPLISGNASLPTDFSAPEIGNFIGGVLEYWLDFLTEAFARVLG